MSQNRDNPSAGGGRPPNRPDNLAPNPDAPADDADVQPDAPLELGAHAQPDDEDDGGIGESNWDSGDIIYMERQLIRLGFQEGNEVVPGQLPEVTERRVLLQDSPTLRRRRSLRRVFERLSPRRAAQRDSPARSGSEPPTARRSRGTQTPPMERKLEQSRKPDDPKK